MRHSIPLHQNESYWLLNEALIEKVRERITLETLSTYPNYDELKEVLATYAEVSPDSVCVTAGSDAAISLLTELCIRKGLQIVLPVPTFYGYERILVRHGATVVPTYYTEKDGKFVFPINETLETITENSALFLCHPNNPLGCTIEDSDIELLLQTAKEKDAIVILDEAYYEYGGTTNAHRVNEQPLVILRTLSKAFGLSGARIGYAISSPSIVKSMQKIQLPWPVAHSSVVSALALLDSSHEVADRRGEVIEERESFRDALSEIPGIETFESSTNFVLIRTDNATEIAAELKKLGILVTTTDFMSSYELAKDLLASTLRIAVPSPKDKKTVLEAIRKASLQLSKDVV